MNQIFSSPLSLSVIDTVKSLPEFFCQNDLLERMTYETGKEFMVQLGNLVILKENLDLIEKIGEGMNQLAVLKIKINVFVGEFGLVFRGLLLQNESLVAVAVKTLKGNKYNEDMVPLLNCDYCCFSMCHFNASLFHFLQKRQPLDLMDS